ncbi:MAG: TIGR04013 family B12-binding domain/radical SAM domain-containing protein [Candidatus Lokiarchaeota archaeon]|nr:TIGR04013 family B12-binding domain/radical SAM domain-containing protein [Candidatus Lokiarchaeota archaeon]MBD3201437.1 TIGR04013 family B12-binding domain/radical SAM domain-containing protein [Candidatus Lokiarchaeota archaeon]
MAFITYYRKDTIFSFNALIGALETDDETKNVDIYYIRNKKELTKKIREFSSKYRKVVAGFSLYTTQIIDYQAIVNEIRKLEKKNIILIAGGAHPSGDPLGSLKMGFDVVFLGEAERSIIEFVKRIKNNQGYENIEGIAFVDNKYKLIKNKKAYRIDLNKYPPFPLINTRFGAIEIARGCPHNCYFCQTSFMMGTEVKYRSIDNVCKYIKILKNENLIDIRFITPDAFSYGSVNGKDVNISKIEELLIRVKKIIGKNGRIFFGSFPSEVRPEHVNREILEIIKQYADNDNLIIGAQSGSQRMLDLCNRGHSIEDVYNAVEITRKAGFNVNVDFIFGLPGEKKEDQMKTLAVMKDLIGMGAKIHAHYFIPLPNTPFSNTRPTKIDEKTQEFIQRNLAQIYGNFRKQEKLAQKVWNKVLKKSRI